MAVVLHVKRREAWESTLFCFSVPLFLLSCLILNVNVCEFSSGFYHSFAAQSFSISPGSMGNSREALSQ